MAFARWRLLMSDFSENLKTSWDIALAVIGAVFAALTTFVRGFADFPLEMRLLTVAAFDIVMVAFVLISLSRSPERPRSYPGSQPPEKQSSLRVAGRIFLIVLACAASVLLLQTTLTYHNIRLSRIYDPNDQFAGRIQLFPSHFATDLKLVLSTPQPVSIVSWRFENCRPGDPLRPPNIRDETDYGATIRLFGFQASQTFCIPYRLSDTANKLELNPESKPYVEILTDDRVRYYRNRIWYFGGALCLLASLYFSSRSSWFRSPSN
jgi:hypothetical protein